MADTTAAVVLAMTALGIFILVVGGKGKGRKVGLGQEPRFGSPTSMAQQRRFRPFAATTCN